MPVNYISFSDNSETHIFRRVFVRVKRFLASDIFLRRWVFPFFGIWLLIFIIYRATSTNTTNNIKNELSKDNTSLDKYVKFVKSQALQIEPPPMPKHSLNRSLILLVTSHDHNLTFTDQQLKLDCGCTVTKNPRLINSAGLVVFDWPKLLSNDLIPNSKQPNQIWIWLNMEPPNSSRKLLDAKKISSKIDCWATYRYDSDIVMRTSKLLDRQEQVAVRRVSLANRPKEAAIIINKCKASNGRDEYIAELSKHISVDVFGACGTINCSTDHQQCLKMIASQYKYYLAFEDVTCSDYMSSDIISILSNFMIIPVIFDDFSYSHNFPSLSYISAREFDKPSQLAEHLKEISSSEWAYNSYFNWKNKKIIEPVPMEDNFCEICSKLEKPSPWSCRRASQSIEHWWFTDSECKTWSSSVQNFIDISFDF